MVICASLRWYTRSSKRPISKNRNIVCLVSVAVTSFQASDRRLRYSLASATESSANESETRLVTGFGICTPDLSNNTDTMLCDPGQDRMLVRGYADEGVP